VLAQDAVDVAEHLCAARSSSEATNDHEETSVDEVGACHRLHVHDLAFTRWARTPPRRGPPAAIPGCRAGRIAQAAAAVGGL